MIATPQLVAGGLGRAVVDAWRPLAAHGGSCLICGPVVAELAAVPENPYPLYDRLCDDGRALFTAWTEAKWALIAHLKGQTAPWGMAGLVGPDAELRAGALTALNARAAQDIFQTADLERREAKIRAVIAAYLNRWVRPGLRVCERCGREFATTRPERWCSETCRRWAPPEEGSGE